MCNFLFGKADMSSGDSLMDGLTGLLGTRATRSAASGTAHLESLWMAATLS